MSNFELKETGDGSFELIGDMSFDTADEILHFSEGVFGRYANVQVDLSRVGKADSAGLALLLEWKAQASRRSGNIVYLNVPDSLLAIAKTAEVSDLI
jgi:phospholipid transport system transporter-binding protein